MRRVARSWGLLFLMLLLVPAMAGAQRSPAISFEANAVVASGLSPGKIVVWFGVERRVDAEYSTDLFERYAVETAGADGTSRFVLDQPVALRSLWVVVDLDSGAFALAAPEGYRLGRLSQPPARLGAGAEAQPDELLDERPYLVGLVVRPGEGAWRFAGGDGGARDEDGQNDGHLRFALDKLEPLPGSPAAPAKVRGADLWFVIDPQRMEISVHKGGVAQ